MCCFCAFIVAATGLCTVLFLDYKQIGVVGDRSEAKLFHILLQHRLILTAVNNIGNVYNIFTAWWKNVLCLHQIYLHIHIVARCF